MLVGSVSSLNSNRLVSLKTKRNENVIENTAFTGIPVKTVHRKASKMVPIALMLVALGLGTLENCKSPVTPPPTEEPTPPVVTPPETPVTPPVTPPVVQSPIQVNMLNMVKMLGLSSSTNDITSFGYYDESEDSVNSLTLNTTATSDNELVYDGTSVDQLFGTTNYVRYKITKPDNEGIIVKKYKTSDSNPPSFETTWSNYSINSKYVMNSDATGAEKYSLNLDDSAKNLLATISPNSTTSLSATTPNDDIYEISSISITTK